MISIIGILDNNDYVEDCIDQSGLIPDMNDMYGDFNWLLMNDDATSHTTASTIDYPKDYCQILEDWPSNPPDLNPIENSWSIFMAKVD